MDEAPPGMLDEAWKAKLVATVNAYHDTNPGGWNDYLAEAAEWDDALTEEEAVYVTPAPDT
jgi:hypothetical protein